jgi:hypothetical protein
MRVTRRDILPKMPKAAFTAVTTVHAVGHGISLGGFSSPSVPLAR